MTQRNTVVATQDGAGLSLCNEYVELTVAPQVGGRVVSLRDRKRGIAWLVSGATERSKPDGPAADWSSFERAGWDECFPNLATGTADSHGPLSDHGELWSRVWDVVSHEDQIELVAQSPRGDYTFRRVLRLVGNQVVADYDVYINSGPAYEFIWSMHPLLPGDADARALLPNGTETTVEHSSLPGIIPGDRLAWGEPPPLLGGWRLGERPSDSLALKLFTDSGAASSATVARQGAALRFDFDRAELPHLGIWLNYGAWPASNDHGTGDVHLAVEPCTAGSDSLETAVANGTAVTLEPGEHRAWSVTLTLDSDRSSP